MAAFVLTGHNPTYENPDTVLVLCEGSRRKCEAEQRRREQYGWVTTLDRKTGKATPD